MRKTKAKTKTKTKLKPQAPAVPAVWRRRFRLLAGYDPVATAGPGEWFDADAAQQACEFFPECLTHIEGRFKGQPFRLQEWEAAIIGCLFGWKRADGSRRYRETFLGVPRGCGKTPLGAGIGILLGFCDGEPGVQGYIIAADIAQAGLAFRHMRGMIDREPALSERCTIRDSYRSIIHRDDPASVIRVLSSDASGKHGQAPHFFICEELHAWDGRRTMEGVESAFAKTTRRQPLLLHITTRDFDGRASVCNEKWGYAERVRDGIVQDSSFFPVLFAAPDDADWRDEKTWELANPNIDVTVDRAALRRMCQKAQENPVSENTFKRLHLNMRTGQDVRIIRLDLWDACAVLSTSWGGAPGDTFGSHSAGPPGLRGRLCYGGLDLASTEDLASFALLFPDEDDWCDLLIWSWCPEARIDWRAVRHVPFDAWAKSGWLEVTTGNQTDYREIRRHILRCRDEWGLEIKEVSFDGWNAAQITSELAEEDGFVMVKVPPTFSTLSAPTKEFLRRVKMGRVRHAGSPLVRWAAANAGAKIEGRVPEGEKLEEWIEKVRIMVSKVHSADKVDPITASVLAFKSLIEHPESAGGSVYDQRVARGEHVLLTI